MWLSSPIPTDDTTSIPYSPRKDTSRSVTASMYGVTTAMREMPSSRSDSTSAPEVVVDTGAPTISIDSCSSSSPALPRMKLPDAQA